MRTSLQWLAACVGFATLVTVAILFEYLIRAGVVDRYLIPPPSDVLAAVIRLIAEEGVTYRFLVTSAETFSAGLLLALIGVPLGVVLYWIPLLRRSFESWLAALAAAPIILAYPLFIVIAGRGSLTVILIAFIAALPAVVLKTLDGLSNARAVYVQVARSLNASRWQVLTKVLFPAALPSIFAGLRLGLLFALLNIVGVEFLINTGGLGQLVNELSERYDLAGMYGAILCTMLVSILFYLLSDRLERSVRSVQ